MPAEVNDIFLEALSLSVAARAELTDRLVASSAEAIDPLIESAHLEEVRRRMGQVDAGKVVLIQGEQVLHEGRALLAAPAAERQSR